MKLAILRIEPEPVPEKKVVDLFLVAGPNRIYLKGKEQDGKEWFILAVHEDGTFERCGGLCIPEFKTDKDLKILEVTKEDCV